MYTQTAKPNKFRSIAPKKVQKVNVEIEAEMDLMGECGRLNQSLLPYKELVTALDALAKNWLRTHKNLPAWW